VKSSIRMCVFWPLGWVINLLEEIDIVVSIMKRGYMYDKNFLSNW
jgi:hypothetical protein